MPVEAPVMRAVPRLIANRHDCSFEVASSGGMRATIGLRPMAEMSGIALVWYRVPIGEPSCIVSGSILFPGIQVLSLAPLSVFEMANLELGRTFYDVRVLSEKAVDLYVDRSDGGHSTVRRSRFDTVIFGGASVMLAVESEAARPSCVGQ